LWFCPTWVIQSTCASCRILHGPMWFWYLLLVGNIHQFWVAALVPESTYAGLWLLDLIEILSRFPYVHTDSYIVSTRLQSVRWWIFRIGIPHTTWRICCSQYGIPVCEYFSDPCTFAYGDPHMRTAIPVCIILHMGIQDLNSHMETISLCIQLVTEISLYAYRHLTNPRMHTGIMSHTVPVCIQWSSRSPYGYTRS
jgi:hypothetical protein